MAEWLRIENASAARWNPVFISAVKHSLFDSYSSLWSPSNPTYAKWDDFHIAIRDPRDGETPLRADMTLFFGARYLPIAQKVFEEPYMETLATTECDGKSYTIPVFFGKQKHPLARRWSI
jgi:hypothetical protein